MNFHAVRRGLPLALTSLKEDGHVNIVHYSHKGTAFILFDFQNVAGF